MCVVVEGYLASKGKDMTKEEDQRWSFDIGQCVTHVAQSLPSLVVWRAIAGPNEIYGLKSYMRGDADSDRVILGDRLRRARVGSGDCANCLLASTCHCPALRIAA